ncbi:hypothetical protein C8J56DRAFT_767774 [Mycena floridula]|nr:hypothetical protein C8J56DRAFT_767774 [Mycena floridula]
MPHGANHPEYASPVMRAPSPASSIGTTYAQDRTSFSDSEYSLNQQTFVRKWENKIGLRDPRPAEQETSIGPLLPRLPMDNSADEQILFDKIIHDLRGRVQDLVDNELFEQTLLMGSQVGFEHQPETDDIDAIMRSMMLSSKKPSSSQNIYNNDPNISQGPWNDRDGFGGMESFQGSDATAGARRKSKGAATSSRKTLY